MKRPFDRWMDGMSQETADFGPGGHAPGDRELDQLAALLSSYGRGRPVPPGLAGRVYRASAELLPGRPGAEGVLRLPRISLGSLWGRLAMAACIGLAFVLAARFMAREPRPLLSPEAELVLVGYAGATGGLPDGDLFSGVEHLLVTRDMTFADLRADLAVVAADLQ